MQCIVITRFDVDTAGVRRHGLPVSEYSKARLPLMMKTLYPSLMNQTDRDFTWVILTGDDSTCDLTHLIRDASPRIVVVPCPPEGGISRARRLATKALYTGGRVLTIRVDSDDLLHKEHIARMKELAEQHDDGTALAFVRAYTLDMGTGLFYEYPYKRLERYPMSLLGYVDDHPGPDPYSLGKHTRVFDNYPYHNEMFPGWARTVHGGNLSESRMHHMDTPPVEVNPSDYGVRL